jgi:hypothetical protein
VRPLLTLLPLLLAASPLAAQVADTVPPPPALLLPDTVIEWQPPSPAGAMVRSMLLPGWGQFYAGAPRRAAVFITLQGASYAMLGKTMYRLGEARDRERTRTTAATEAIWEQAAQDTALARRLQEEPGFLEEQLGQDPLVADARGLVRARTRHREDWITYTLVTTMASALDAYVAAHLASFPADISTELRPGGGMSVRFDVPVGGVGGGGRR